MARQINNIPTIRSDRLRLVVEARKALPKAFVWKIVRSDDKGSTLKLSSEPQSWPTMEAAYIAGSAVLSQVK